MSKRKRLTGRERRELRRRARGGPQLPKLSRRRLLLIGGGVATAVAIVVALAVFVLQAGGGSSAVANPTPGATVVVEQTPQSSGPPAVSGQPRVTGSGLGIIDISVGSGATPKAGQTIVVDYTGWLSDGTKFASSVGSGSPFEFVLGTGQVIAGWEEGLATMKVGGQRRLIIPASLAYGAKGRPPAIPANSELTFDLDLRGIK